MRSFPLSTISSRRGLRRARGFTLIELLIAITIFAIVSVLSVGSLLTLLPQQQYVEKNIETLSELQLLFSRLERELSQVSPRQVRDEYGELLPAISSEPESLGVDSSVISTGDSISFTHAGVYSFDSEPVTLLQRVSYSVEGNKIKRYFWSVLDRAEDTTPSVQVLMEAVDSFSIEYLDSQGQWQTNWNESQGVLGNAPTGVSLEAVKITVSSGSYKDVYRIFPLVSG